MVARLAPAPLGAGMSDATAHCQMYANRAFVCRSTGVAVSIPIAAGLTNLSRILQTIGSQTPAAGTPTAQALRQAYAYYTTGAGQALTGSKWVLLATDGGPNCNSTLTCNIDKCTQNIDGNCGPSATTTENCCTNAGAACLDDQATMAAITQLASTGIDTFVVGIPGSEVYANSLNAFALAGKQPNPAGQSGTQYFAVSATSALQDLKTAFSQITSQLLRSCDIPLASTPLVTQDRVNVAIDCALQPAVSGTPGQDAGQDGFYIDYSQNPAHLMLVGAPCTYLQNYGARHVDIVEGCQSIN